MGKNKLTVILISGLLLIVASNGFAQKESKGYWLNLLSYDKLNVASNFKIFNGGIITPGKWIGFGLSLGDLYSTTKPYIIFNDNDEKKGNYGMLSLITPSLHFIPFASLSKTTAFDGNSMNLLHLYLSYSPWSALNLSNKETEDIPIKIMGKSRVFDIGIAYTFSFISFLPVSIKAGYINMFNRSSDVYAFHFPSSKFNYFYYGLNISLGAWNTGGLHVKDKYTVVPFMANSCKAIRYHSKMEKDWKTTRMKGTIEAYQEFLSKYPHEKISQQAHENLIQLYEQRDWELAKSSRTVSDLKQFVAQYPSGKYTGQAQEIISCFLLRK